MSESKLAVIDLASTITNYDIIAIQETRLMPHKHPRWLQEHPDFAVTSIPSESAKRGTGLLLLHRRNLQPTIWAITTTPYLSIWLCISSSVTGLHDDLIVAGVYVPPCRQRAEQREMWAALSSQAKSASKAGLLVLMGDFNARLGELNDLASPVRWRARFPNDAGIVRPPARQSGTDAATNSYGYELAGICREYFIVPLTGRAPGDVPAAISCQPLSAAADAGRSRNDHICASAELFHRFRHHHVHNLRRPTCDHALLEATMELPPQPSPSAPPPPRPPPPPDALRWRPDLEPLYLCELQGRLPLVEVELSVACAGGDIDTAAATLTTCIRDAAVAAGMTNASPYNLRGARRQQHIRETQQPWFDHECRDARDHLKQALQLAPFTQTTRDLRIEFRRLLRRKKAAYLHPASMRSVEQLKHDPARFWRRVLRKKTGLSPGLDNAAAAVDYYSAAFAAAPAASQRAGDWLERLGGARKGKPGEGDELSRPFTSAEVSAQLMALKCGTAAGPAAIATDFFRQAFTTDEHNNIDFLLAPALSELFTTCLQVGRAPADWQRALVTPVPKPGCNPALLTSYRPIAVGSVLPKIYARTLNARLVGWAEKNNKHAPEQAGFRPGMNTENHLFHLRHVWDVSQQPGAAPMYLAFVDLKQAYDRVLRPLIKQNEDNLIPLTSREGNSRPNSHFCYSFRYTAASAATVAAAARRLSAQLLPALSRLRWENAAKGVFWLLALDGVHVGARAAHQL